MSKVDLIAVQLFDQVAAYIKIQVYMYSKVRDYTLDFEKTLRYFPVFIVFRVSKKTQRGPYVKRTGRNW